MRITVKFSCFNKKQIGILRPYLITLTILLMKKFTLLLAMCLYLVGCNKSPQEHTEEPSDTRLTKEEALVLANHIKGKSVNEAEVASEAQSIMAFLDQSPANSRSVKRRIANITAAKRTLAQTRTVGGIGYYGLHR